MDYVLVTSRNQPLLDVTSIIVVSVVLAQFRSAGGVEMMAEPSASVMQSIAPRCSWPAFVLLLFFLFFFYPPPGRVDQAIAKLDG